jgi:hypothetical protein
MSLKLDVDLKQVCPGSVQEHGVPSNDTHLAISSFEHWYGTPLGEHAHGAGRQAFWANVTPIFGLVLDKQLTLHSSNVVQSIE